MLACRHYPPGLDYCRYEPAEISPWAVSFSCTNFLASFPLCLGLNSGLLSPRRFHLIWLHVPLILISCHARFCSLCSSHVLFFSLIVTRTSHLCLFPSDISPALVPFLIPMHTIFVVSAAGHFHTGPLLFFQRDFSFLSFITTYNFIEWLFIEFHSHIKVYAL